MVRTQRCGTAIISSRDDNAAQHTLLGLHPSIWPRPHGQITLETDLTCRNKVLPGKCTCP